ncbi:uncharacterized protein LOC142177063 [Nicotiana tabacum]|uniref:Uncharacterized protein LOC142177063 n=1 Tax=Nicotiana tabacum TaxID=4097 RepID=A0AC58TWN2_TOBAC
MLNEVYVPIETTVEQLERMAERFFEVNRISFSLNGLPPEGAAHNKALHLTVKCEGYYVKIIMLDGRFGVDICPLSTLLRMEIGTERIKPNTVCVRDFGGVKRDTIGEINLILTIGPVDFEVTFQVLDMATSYNFLLGRPWIHAAGAVPSTLHQMVKFEHENQEIMVHGEDKQSIYKDPSEEIKETIINIHAEEKTRDALIRLLFEFKEVFAWSYYDMPGLSVDIVVQKLPTYPGCPPIQQK